MTAPPDSPAAPVPAGLDAGAAMVVRPLPVIGALTPAQDPTDAR